MASILTPTQIIKSPLNYIGGKQKILPQLLPLFPKKISTFVDLFTGGVNIGLNVIAEKIICNDNLIYLIDMYNFFKKNDLNLSLTHIQNQIKKFNLSLENEEGYKNIRNYYNKEKHPLDLFVLIAFSFNHQIRFNNKHEFNNPFGRERSCFNQTMKNNLIVFINKIKQSDINFVCFNFESFPFENLCPDDFVYCDPPYLISTGTYNDGKRGFTGWNNTQEQKLLQLLEKLHQRDIKFALSNVITHKGEDNIILKDWINKHDFLRIFYVKNNYANSNYQTIIRDKNASIEVLITNYEPEKNIVPNLFD